MATCHILHTKDAQRHEEEKASQPTSNTNNTEQIQMLVEEKLQKRENTSHFFSMTSSMKSFDDEKVTAILAPMHTSKLSVTISAVV